MAGREPDVDSRAPSRGVRQAGVGSGAPCDGAAGRVPEAGSRAPSRGVRQACVGSAGGGVTSLRDWGGTVRRGFT
ncbi:hypothetical protein [Dactylosporangium sp. CA-139066]|uniref:hypothetical protein n=1 Tax=Dactylosporangium sp. CA-139066 TaxID=3239930 RepID=UPI003D8F97A5